MSNRITSGKTRSGIAEMLTLLLLILCIAGASQVEILHRLVHDHSEAVAHAEEQEKDPCHRVIDHQDFDQNCGHESHLIVSDDCPMCDLVYQGDQSLFNATIFLTPERSHDCFNSYKEHLDSYWAVLSSSRAPPTLLLVLLRPV